MTANNACENLTSWQLIPGTCTVVYFDEQGNPNPIDFGFLLDKIPPEVSSTFDYLENSHTVVHNNVPHQLNCGVFSFNPATCQLSYTNEKGQSVSYFIPQDQFIVSADGCSLIIMPAKTGIPITVPLGVPASDVGFVLNGKNLEFTYKDKKCVVPLPNGVIGCQYQQGTNTLRMLFCDGTFDEKVLAKANLTCNVLDNGQRVFHFTDGCGGEKFFDIDVPNMDIDNLVVTGSLLNFTFGGDGNENNVAVDICQIVADNCNATITSIDPITGGFTFIDNKGDPFAVPGHAAPEVVGSGDINVTPSVGPNGQIIYTVDYVHTPSDPAPVVVGSGDTTVTPSAGPNGETIYTVDYNHTPSDPPPQVIGGGDINVTPTPGPDGQIVYVVEADFPDFPEDMVGCCTYHTESNILLDPANPPNTPSNPPSVKNPGDTAITKHPNGLSFYTCSTAGWDLNYFCLIPDEFTPPDPKKETFKAGDILPEPLSVATVVCRVTGNLQTLPIGTSQIPSGVAGCFQVDETDGTIAYIPPKYYLLDCTGTIVKSGDKVRKVGEGLIRLPCIASPDDCIPPDAPCESEGYYIEDEYGTGWEKQPGDAVDAWVQKKKATCSLSYYTPFNPAVTHVPVLDGQDFDWQPVAPAGDFCFEIENPTCDLFMFDIDTTFHVQMQIHSSELPSLQLWAGLEMSVDGGVTWQEFNHHVLRREPLTVDFSNGTTIQNRLSLQPKSTVAVCFRFISRIRGPGGVQATSSATGAFNMTTRSNFTGSALC